MQVGAIEKGVEARCGVAIRRRWRPNNFHSAAVLAARWCHRDWCKRERDPSLYGESKWKTSVQKESLNSPSLFLSITYIFLSSSLWVPVRTDWPIFISSLQKKYFKIGPNSFETFWAILKHHTFLEGNNFGHLLGIYWKIWVTFNSSLWLHCLWHTSLPLSYTLSQRSNKPYSTQDITFTYTVSTTTTTTTTIIIANILRV